MKQPWAIIAAITIPIILVGAIIYLGSIKPSSPPISQNNLSQFNTAPSPDPTLAPASTDSATSTPSAVAPTTQKEDNPKTMTKPPEMQIDKNKTYTAILKTSAGDVAISLSAKDTPITVNNFVSLARSNFYNNTIFHRVIKGFMIQGGDPKGDGTGGPGYDFDDEPFAGDYTRGTVAMANAGPNTNGSQFFIVHQDTPLEKNYVIFGKVTSGMEVIDKIAASPTQPGGEGSRPVTPVKISSVEIEEK